MFVVYNCKTNEVVSKHKDKGDAMLEANRQNDRYAIQLIKSGKAPREFPGIYGFKEMK